MSTRGSVVVVGGVVDTLSFSLSLTHSQISLATILMIAPLWSCPLTVRREREQERERGEK